MIHLFGCEYVIVSNIKFIKLQLKLKESNLDIFSCFLNNKKSFTDQLLLENGSETANIVRISNITYVMRSNTVASIYSNKINIFQLLSVFLFSF